MAEEERHGDAWHAVRRKPVGREPEVRFEANAAPLELLRRGAALRVHGAARDLEAEVAEAEAQQRGVVESFPAIGDAGRTRSRAHGAPVYGHRGDRSLPVDRRVDFRRAASATGRALPGVRVPGRDGRSTCYGRDAMLTITGTSRIVLLAAAGAAFLVAPARAQINDLIRGAPSEANHFIETPRGWRHPQTPWGEPDIQATLNMMQAAGVPLERCANSYRAALPPVCGAVAGAGGGARPRACDMNKKWLTEEEYARAWSSRAVARREPPVGRRRSRARDEDRHADPNIPQRQTNLIVDPANGLLPPLTPEGKRRALAMRSDWALPGETIAFDGPQDFDSWDRCITRGMPSSMMPYRYNGGFTIRQAPGYVIFRSRDDPRSARDSRRTAAHRWRRRSSNGLGESRGRWEGNTLVVETTNYQEGPPLINLAVVGSPPGNRFPHSDQMKTTERIVRLERRHVALRDHDRGSGRSHGAVHGPLSDAQRPDLLCARVRVPRGQHDRPQLHEHEPSRARESDAGAAAAARASRAGVADALAGRWVGRPRIVTIDVDIELEFIEERGRHGQRQADRHEAWPHRPTAAQLRDRGSDRVLHAAERRSVAVLRRDGRRHDHRRRRSAQGGVPVTFRRRPCAGSPLSTDG